MASESESAAGDSCELRVAICADTMQQPAWIYEMLSEMRRLSNVRIVVTIVSAARKNRSIRDRMGLIVSLWSRFERRWVEGQRDALAPIDCAPLLAESEKLTVDTSAENSTESELISLRQQTPDVLIDLSAEPLCGAIVDVPRFGTWSVRFGTSPERGGAAAGAWEVLLGEPLTISALARRHADGSETVLAQSVAATDRSSIVRNRNHCCWKTAQFVPRHLAKLQHSKSKPTALQAQAADNLPAASRSESNWAALKGIARLGGKTLLNRVADRRTREEWFIAYRMQKEIGALPESLSGLSTLESPPDRYWADPFPVQNANEYCLFFEEVLHATGRGRIAVRRWRDGAWDEPRAVLDRPYHLSYPFVFSWENRWYLVPESIANRTVELWGCEEFPTRWKFECNLMEGVRAADSTIFERDGQFWMFTCVAAEGATANDELFLFHAPTPLGPWTPHKKNPVVSDARCARPAGRVFFSHGKWLRPAQDCVGHYGRRIHFREIVTLNPCEYAERALSTIEPDWMPGLIATHTYNRSGELTVIDGLRRRRR